MNMNAAPHPLRRLLVATLLVAAAVVVGAAPAHAANPKALVLANSVLQGLATDGSGLSLEEEQAVADGFDVTIVQPEVWAAMSTADFRAYQVLIMGDPQCGGLPSTAVESASAWMPAVMASGGNRVVIGTDYALHNSGPLGTARGDLLAAKGIAYAGARAGATGAFVALSCNVPDDSVAFLDGLSSAAGTDKFTMEMPGCESDISIVAQSGPTGGLHDADLSQWGCSVHIAMTKWATDFTPLAIATDSATKNYCAKDVDTGLDVCGAPYILVAGTGVTVTSNISLAPLTATNLVGTDHTVTATVLSGGSPVSGVVVTFSVTVGPNTGKSATATTDAVGHASWTYHDDGGAGTDTINAQFTNTSNAIEKATASKTWAVAPPADVAEVPMAILLPASAAGLLVLAAGIVGVRRRRTAP
jgi:hypothetical protein